MLLSCNKIYILHALLSHVMVKKCLQVLDEDVASPAELAKAYMGSKPSKVSPSMLGIRSQALREDSTVISSGPFLQKSPIMPLVLRSSGHAGYPENGFMTPRSRGKSAIYSMARTPYSKVNPTSTIKVFLLLKIVSVRISLFFLELSSYIIFSQKKKKKEKKRKFLYHLIIL